MAAKKTKSAPEQGNGFQGLPPNAKDKGNSAASQKRSAEASKPKSKITPARRESGIPEAVSKRMVRRMIAFCGVPTLLGLASFPVGYFVLKQGIELPNVVVLLVSLGCLGLGVLGLSYGVLSAAWDEEPGTLLGWSEFQINLGRTLGSWKAARERNQQ
jgi:Photosynthesis affected mutant 68